MDTDAKNTVKKSAKVVIGILAVIGALALIYIVMLIINIYKYIHPTPNDNLTDAERVVLAEEFELEGVTDKITAAVYTDDCFRVEVKYFETCEEMLDGLEFSSDGAKNTALELLGNLEPDSGAETYKNLYGDEIQVTALSSHDRLFAGEQYVTIYVFRDEDGYGFIAEKGMVINGQALRIAQGR